MSRKQITKPKAILMRVFGVTTSHSFKKDQLDAFVQNNLKTYIDEKWGDEDLWDSIVSMKDESNVERRNNKNIPRIANNCETDENIKETVIQYVSYRLTQPEEDIQSEYRTFHTLLWHYGYTKQQLKTELYPDIVESVNKWREKGINIFSISSYSDFIVKAMLRNTNVGDITNLFTGHIVVHEVNTEDYVEACNEIHEQPSSCLFVVENITEAQTIIKVGAKCVLVNRENKQFAETEVAELSVVNSFENIVFVE